MRLYKKYGIERSNLDISMQHGSDFESQFYQALSNQLRHLNFGLVELSTRINASLKRMNLLEAQTA